MQVLVLLAHADDETLGAGGTIQKLVAHGHQVQLIIVSDGIVAMRNDDSDNRDALEKACGMLGLTNVECLGFKDQRFDTYPVAEIANRVSQTAVSPDLIITHSDKDLNSDHRIVNEVAKIMGRPRHKQIGMLGCEIPSVIVWNDKAFEPRFYVDISDQLETKINAFSCYTNELKAFPDPYSSEGLRTLAKFRGMESGYQAAEAFEVIRWFAHLSF